MLKDLALPNQLPSNTGAGTDGSTDRIPCIRSLIKGGYIKLQVQKFDVISRGAIGLVLCIASHTGRYLFRYSVH
jgi:hypothetical protein